MGDMISGMMGSVPNVGLAGFNEGLGMINQNLSVEESNAAWQQNANYNQQMSSTAFQRATTDMKAAGLNPILAGMNQSQSASPNPGQAPMPTVNAPPATSMLSTAQGVQDLNNAKKSGDLLAAQKTQADSQTLLNTVNASIKKPEANWMGVVNGFVNSAKGYFSDTTSDQFPQSYDKNNTSEGGSPALRIRAQ